MAQNLKINNVTYNNVSSLSVPKATSGNAIFPDTSDATAIAADILSGKTAYVNGSKITGTSSGGAPNLQSKSVTYTSNGSATVTPDSGYDGLSSVAVTVSVSGGGGPSALSGLRFQWNGIYGSGFNMNLDDVQFDEQYIHGDDYSYEPFSFANLSISNCSFYNCSMSVVSFENAVITNCTFAFDDYYFDSPPEFNSVTFEGATVNGKTGTDADEELLNCFDLSGSTTAGIYWMILPSGAEYNYPEE